MARVKPSEGPLTVRVRWICALALGHDERERCALKSKHPGARRNGNASRASESGGKQASGTSEGNPPTIYDQQFPLAGRCCRRLTDWQLCQMTLQQTSNTTHRSGLITPSQTPKRSSSRMSSTQSLNHLLNFTLPPRQSPQSIPRRTRRTNGSVQVWNKEREYAAVQSG